MDWTNVVDRHDCLSKQWMSTYDRKIIMIRNSIGCVESSLLNGEVWRNELSKSNDPNRSWPHPTIDNGFRLEVIIFILRTINRFASTRLHSQTPRPIMQLFLRQHRDRTLFFSWWLVRARALTPVKFSSLLITASDLRFRHRASNRSAHSVGRAWTLAAGQLIEVILMQKTRSKRTSFSTWRTHSDTFQAEPIVRRSRWLVHPYAWDYCLSSIDNCYSL